MPITTIRFQISKGIGERHSATSNSGPRAKRIIVVLASEFSVFNTGKFLFPDTMSLPTVLHSGRSGTGLQSVVVRDLQSMTPRPPLPKRALPDDVRAKLILKPDDAPARATGMTTRSKDEHRDVGKKR